MSRCATSKRHTRLNGSREIIACASCIQVHTRRVVHACQTTLYWCNCRLLAHIKQITMFQQTLESCIEGLRELSFQIAVHVTRLGLVPIPAF